MAQCTEDFSIDRKLGAADQSNKTLPKQNTEKGLDPSISVKVMKKSKI